MSPLNSDDTSDPMGASTQQPSPAQQPPVPSESQTGSATHQQDAEANAEVATPTQDPTATQATATSSKDGAQPGTASQKDTVKPTLLTTSRVLDPFSLPPHKNIGNDSSTVIAAAVALECLDTGKHFIDSVLTTFKFDTKSKRLPPGNNEVFISKGKHNGETWVARSSSHSDEASESSATLAEFEKGLKDNHSKNEAEYTHLADSIEVASWDLARDSIEGWTAVTMEFYEQVHKLPPPLQKRVFAVLVVTGRETDSNHFIIVQAPVDLHKAPLDIYSNGKKARNVTIGRYASVEDVQKNEEGKIQWQMATASDARGALSSIRGLQNLGIPDAIAKDVPLFLEWTIKKRG